MTIQAYSTQAGRINEIKGEMLAVAEPFECLSMGCTMKKMPKNKGDNISYRRVIPKGGATTNANTINRWSVTTATHLVQEGVTPTAEGITYQDVNVAVLQYACLYSYTDKAAELYEDDIPRDEQDQAAMRMALLREMIRYGSMKAGTNVQFQGGTTRATVDEAISINGLRLMARTLLANHAGMKTKVLKPGPQYDTSAIEPGFIVFCHTDCAADIRRLENFVPTIKYAQGSSLSPKEIGSVEEFRFIISPELASYPDAGAAVGTTGLYSTTLSNLDVYPMIICGEDAVFDVGLNLNFDVIHIPHTVQSKEDPLNQRGYVGAKFYSATLVTNNGWMGVIECGVTKLD